MIVVNKEWCKGCRICIECCPVHALAESDETNKRGIPFPKLKEKDRCIKCRLCELQCPDMAIFVVIEKYDKDSSEE